MSEDNGNPAEALQKLLDKKNGDASAVAMMLIGENFELRRKNADLRGKVPADGSVVISADDNKLLDAAKALNVKADELKPKFDSIATLETENAGLKKQTVFHEVEKTGWNPSVLRDFDTLEGGLEYKVETEKDKDGKEHEVAYVIKDGKKTALEEYAKEKRPDLLPVLKKEAQGATTGTDYVSQSAGGKAAPANVYDKIRQNQKAKQETMQQAGNPLNERFGLQRTA